MEACNGECDTVLDAMGGVVVGVKEVFNIRGDE